MSSMRFMMANPFYTPHILVPRAHRPLANPIPPPPDPGDRLIKQLRTAEVTCSCKTRLRTSSDQAFCEVWMLRRNDPKPDGFFADQDVHCLFVAVTLPINCSIAYQERASPVAIVDKFVGWRGNLDAPTWARWEPDKAHLFLSMRAAVAEVFGDLALTEHNTEVVSYLLFH
ncbi:hypothetical protein GLOTRDRAFT_126188 [Gloeophyllum trabeum ATCC 11539]|uniref:Uncharacterized protein n=1 Tax=Gloeophyllum trabeum (strain ATCC 11539 / FP-39264 / Madison 617) TaxID=670483 RepID=S7RWJ2_GLOTA|nr:uncharacterized protein GLOTRDRAFT_126188 [Gloeophyllum trabeum ATCC 11539]EPQ57699.1 hypothetical protein GLOTRDRAFT_126188 [Gloeophyllum trabeum ATCC 11539]